MREAHLTMSLERVTSECRRVFLSGIGMLADGSGMKLGRPRLRLIQLHMLLVATGRRGIEPDVRLPHVQTPEGRLPLLGVLLGMRAT